MRKPLLAMIGFSAACLSATGVMADESYRGRDFIGGNGLPSVTPWGDTYVGAASAATIPGNGTFFYIKNVQPTRFAPSPRVRTVTAATSDCAWEMGVCVIRRER